jgi:transcriptional regulator with XRE-family HTH domain
MDPLLVEFGRNVARARKRAGLTQEGLEDLCEIEAAEISRIENGWVNVTIRRVARLAEALELTPGQLLDGAFEGRGRAGPN